MSLSVAGFRGRQPGATVTGASGNIDSVAVEISEIAA